MHKIWSLYFLYIFFLRKLPCTGSEVSTFCIFFFFFRKLPCTGCEVRTCNPWGAASSLLQQDAASLASELYFFDCVEYTNFNQIFLKLWKHISISYNILQIICICSIVKTRPYIFQSAFLSAPIHSPPRPPTSGLRCQTFISSLGYLSVIVFHVFKKLFMTSPSPSYMFDFFSTVCFQINPSWGLRC